MARAPSPEGVIGEASLFPMGMPQTSSEEMDKRIRRVLFKHAMEGNWRKVVAMYLGDVQKKKITRAKDTLLHLAVSEGKTNVIKDLVNAIELLEAETILKQENKRGETPLHLAAALGMVEACEILASKSPKVIVEARNENGETPLFVAARYGKEEAFFALHDRIPQTSDVSIVSYCRNNGGDTILHTAINGEHFALAFEIIQLYPDFVNYNNARGQSALHLLANKPAVFKSGSHIRRLNNLIYSCIIVDPLNRLTNRKKPKENRIKWPKNYETCSDIFGILEKPLPPMEASSQGSCWKNFFNDRDEEDPKESSENITVEGGQDQGQSNGANQSETRKAHQAQPQLPKNCFRFFQMVMTILFNILGIGLWKFEKMKRKKKKHRDANQLMDELVDRGAQWEYQEDGKKPASDMEETSKEDGRKPASYEEGKGNGDGPRKCKCCCISQEKDIKSDQPETDTPIIIAAKMGVLEMVKKILDTIPVAVEDLDSNDKNIVLLAVEFRQTHVYKYMLGRQKKESILGRVDKKGNSALHLAAKCGQISPWIVTGAALQMQWEAKWYKFVKKSMQPGFFPHQNSSGQTARDIFNETHKTLLKEGREWLTKTSESCSVVAALIATVAFTSATSVPGGLKQDSGFPILEGQPAFSLFALSALVALCFSVTALVMFLAILTSRHHEKDFEYSLPVKVIVGLTSLFLSITAMLVSFCAGHFYVIEMKLKYAAYPIYAVTCLPISFFAFVQFPLYIDLIKATIVDVPERSGNTYAF